MVPVWVQGPWELTAQTSALRVDLHRAVMRERRTDNRQLSHFSAAMDHSMAIGTDYCEIFKIRLHFQGCL